MGFGGLLCRSCGSCGSCGSAVPARNGPLPQVRLKSVRQFGCHGTLLITAVDLLSQHSVRKYPVSNGGVRQQLLQLLKPVAVFARSR